MTPNDEGTHDMASTTTEAPAKAKKSAKKAAKKAAAATATPQRVDITAVMASVDQGEALRDRIKELTATLKIHEDNIKDALGDATVGTDAKGHVLVRFPFRNRSGLSKDRVKALLSDEDYAQCETVTPYRTLLYGES
jgi:predicted phage-related endonuclease